MLSYVCCRVLGERGGVAIVNSRELKSLLHSSLTQSNVNEPTATAIGTSSMVAAVHRDMHDNTTKIKEDDCACLYVCVCVCDRERERGGGR